MFKYGNLRNVEGKGWLFIKDNDEVEELGEAGFVEVLNILGIDGWELIELEPEVGYVFKKEVNK